MCVCVPSEISGTAHPDDGEADKATAWSRIQRAIEQIWPDYQLWICTYFLAGGMDALGFLGIGSAHRRNHELRRCGFQPLVMLAARPRFVSDKCLPWARRAPGLVRLKRVSNLNRHWSRLKAILSRTKVTRVQLCQAPFVADCGVV